MPTSDIQGEAHVSSFMSSTNSSLQSQPSDVRNHRKRARKIDVENEVEIVSVKRPKIEPSGIVAFLIETFSAMADWMRRRGAAFKNNFYTLTGEEEEEGERGDGNGGEEGASAGGEGPGSRAGHSSATNGSGIGAGALPTSFNFGRRPLHAGQQTDQASMFRKESLFRPVPPGPGIQNGRHEGRSVLGRGRALFGRHPERRGANLTVRNCIRLGEKEQYRRLLQHFTPSMTLTSSSLRKPRLRLLDSQPGARMPDVSVLGTELPVRNLRTGTELPVRNLGAGSSRSRVGESVMVAAPSVKPYPSRRPSSDLDIPLGSIVRHQQWRRRQEERESPALDDSSIILVSDSLPSGSGEQTAACLLPEEEETEAAPQRRANGATSKALEWKRSIAPFIGDRFSELKLSMDEEDKERKRQIAETEMELQICEERQKEMEKILRRRIKHSLRVCAREPPVMVESSESSAGEELEEEEDEGALPELTEEMMNVVNRAFNPGPNDMLVEGFRLQIKRSDIATLRGTAWLNDEVINFYMNLLMERGEKEGRPKVYAFNTFFFTKLQQEGHSGVRRWTRRVDLFAMDYVIIPVHLGVHWCLAIISMKHKTIRYYDSMGGVNKSCLQALERYLKDESVDKRKTPLDFSGWTVECASDIPQQMNGSDCGVFACKFAEYVTREAPITFTQEDMPYFRQRMVYEILTKKLLQ